MNHCVVSCCGVLKSESLEDVVTDVTKVTLILLQFLSWLAPSLPSSLVVVQ